MLLKCVETIYRPPHEGEEIVRHSGKPEKQLHNRYGYGFRYTTESSPRDSRGLHPNRCGNEHRSGQGLTVIIPDTKGAPGGYKLSGAPFSFSDGVAK